jgi:hypothetical protein
VTAGKQRYSWQRRPSLFFDGDVNPEGISVNYSKGNLFAGVFHDWLAERALSFSNVTSGTNTDSMLYGAQLGYRIPISDAVRLTVAGTYFNFDGVQGYNPLFGGSAFGNTTVTGAACNRTLAANTPCLASDFDVIEGFADLTATVAGRPLRVFLDYARNTAAEVNAVAGEKLDTALAFGVGYGAASATPRTWEIGALYQQIEKDSLSIPGFGLRRRQHRFRWPGAPRRLHAGAQSDLERHAVPEPAFERRPADGDGVQFGYARATRHNRDPGDI